LPNTPYNNDLPDLGRASVRSQTVRREKDELGTGGSFIAVQDGVEHA
jgi:hypothetical protein